MLSLTITVLIVLKSRPLAIAPDDLGHMDFDCGVAVVQ